MILFTNDSLFRRFKKPDPKSTKPPSLPPPAKSPIEISTQAAQVGEREGRRLRKRTGRRATRVSRPELATVPAQTTQAKLGGV